MIRIIALFTFLFLGFTQNARAFEVTCIVRGTVLEAKKSHQKTYAIKLSILSAKVVSGDVKEEDCMFMFIRNRQPEILLEKDSLILKRIEVGKNVSLKYIYSDENIIQRSGLAAKKEQWIQLGYFDAQNGTVRYRN